MIAHLGDMSTHTRQEDSQTEHSSARENGFTNTMEEAGTNDRYDLSLVTDQ